MLQSQASVNKTDIGPADVQTRFGREEGVDAIAVIAGMRAGAPRREDSCEKLGSATKGARTGSSLVAAALTSI